MSMSPEQENFEPLRRVLVLKQYEQPPPRYFNEFSGRVITRLRAGERGQWQDSSLWLQSLWAFLDTRPALAASFGAAAVAVVISGVVFSDRLGSEPAALLPESQFSALNPANISPPLAAQPTFFQANTNELTDSLFKEIGQPAVVPVNAIEVSP